MPTPTDSMLSEDSRKVAARADGLVGVFATLAAQHAAIAEQLERLIGAPEKKPEMWPEIRRELLSHERSEVQEVYPVLRENPDIRALADLHDEEASDMESLIEEIDGGQVDWQTLFDQLVDAVLQHADLEEQEIFPRAQQVIGDTATRALEPRFLAAQQRIASAV